MIFVGIGLACITLGFEYWWYKYRKGSKVIAVHEAPKPPIPKHFAKDVTANPVQVKKIHQRAKY